MEIKPTNNLKKSVTYFRKLSRKIPSYSTMQHITFKTIISWNRITKNNISKAN